MRIMNKKGVADLVIITAIAVIGLVTWITGPKLIGAFTNLDKNQNKQTHKVSEKYTYGRLDEHGKFVKLGDYEKKEDFLNLIAQEPPEKWSTKVKIVIGMAILLAIAFPGIAIRVILKAKSNFAQLVTGIEQAKKKLPAEAIVTLTDNLSKKMDTTAKKEVKAIVAKIPAEDIKV